LNKKYIFLVILILLSIGNLYSIDIVDQIATFIGKDLPEKAKYIDNSNLNYYILTLSDKYDSQETLFFWVDNKNKVERVCYKITCKPDYSISNRQLDNIISEIRYESKTITEKADGVPYGSYKYGEYSYKKYIIIFSVSYSIPLTSVKSIEWIISINPDAPIEVNYNGFIGYIKDNEITITDYNGSLKNITIPSIINGIKVTNIGKEAFAQKRLNNVIIPQGIKNIGEHAFYMNELTNVTIPNSVTNIEGGAFWKNKLTKVNIPNSVLTIGVGAFMDNNLSTVTIPNIEIIETNLFANNQLTNIKIPETVKIIKDGAFYGNKLTSIKFPNNIKRIYNAFGNNKIIEVIIGSDVEIYSNRRYEDKGSFNPYFVEYYNELNKSAGKYVLAEINSTWFKIE